MVGERYSDWQLIGRGGMAEVFKATDHELGCAVAIKLLNEKFRSNDSLMRGLRAEVLISRALRHPNICPIHDIYEGPRGFGIVMDLIEGCDLRAWMDDNNSHLLQTAPERLTVLYKIAEALEVAHSRIIHRDLKPSNIYLVGNDIERPVIMDFGISILGVGGTGNSFAGTPKYASPEQFEAPEKVDRRSDLFSLGIMGYELLTGGRVPPCSLRRVRSEGKVPRIPISEITPPSNYCAVIPASLDRIILHMLEYNPESRPASAQEVADVLRQCELVEPSVGGGREILGRPETVTIVGGAEHNYYVGSGPDGEIAAEKPMRRVILSGFEMAVTPVTNFEYRTFVERTGHPAPPWINHPTFGADDHPVVGITWGEAMAYAAWRGGRLPTEIEWECAAKAGEKVRCYPWGEESPNATRANIDGLCNGTTPVRAYANGRNPLGLWDMCGNVWEWCADAWDEGLYRNFANGSVDPVNDEDSALRSIRGGGFESFATMGRCSFRHYATRDERRPDIGMRMVYDLAVARTEAAE